MPGGTVRYVGVEGDGSVGEVVNGEVAVCRGLRFHPVFLGQGCLKGIIGPLQGVPIRDDREVDADLLDRIASGRGDLASVIAGEGAGIRTVAGIPESGSDSSLGAGETPPAEEPPSVPEKVVDYKVNQELFNHYTTTFGSHLAAAFVEIENTGNTPLYLHDGQFDVEDNNGHLLTTQTLVSTCPDALRPGETGYFYSDYIDLSDVDDSNGLVFVPHYKVDEARHEIIDYEVSDLGIREDDMFKCKVSGRLTNTQDEEINLLYVYVIYYDSEGRVLGISGTNITDVQPGDTTSFELIGQFFYDGVTYSDIAEYKVIPRAWYMQF